MVYNRLQSSFVLLAWPWSCRSLPKGNQWECWDPGLGPNVVRLPVLLLPSDQPKAWQVDILSHGWLAGHLQLADCLLNKMSTLPSPQAETSCGHVCNHCGHIDQMYPTVETSNGQVWNYCEQAALQSDVPPARDISWPSVVLLWAGWPSVRCNPPNMRLQARFAFGQMSDQHYVRCIFHPPTEKTVWVWKEDWPPWTTSTWWKTFYPGG